MMLHKQNVEEKNEFQGELNEISLRLEEFQLSLNDKIDEVAQKNNFISELQQEIEKLEADVIDKTKVIELTCFLLDKLNLNDDFSGGQDFKPATSGREKNASRRDQEQQQFIDWIDGEQRPRNFDSNKRWQ